jgi:hypothetical protein
MLKKIHFAAGPHAGIYGVATPKGFLYQEAPDKTAGPCDQDLFACPSPGEVRQFNILIKHRLLL